jgi:hypothetical protein
MRAADLARISSADFVQTKGPGVGIVMVEVVMDGRFQFGHRGEDTAPDAVMSDQAEEALAASLLLRR